MNSRQLDEERIFHVAREIPNPDARAEYLDQVCAGDQALRERVEALIQVHEREQGFLKSDGNLEATVNRPEITEAVGQQIGRYKLLQKIGEGGFGVVYMAEQVRPVRRKVALKIIKPGMDTRSVVARFEAERQALALMDHPNIAHVLDGGATQHGRPYFVMELVKGVPITEYCDKNQVATSERLQLFVSVCHAVQHAHQKGIIHRDLKPSNILVTLHDGQPVIKVIDFGVAKAINQQLTEKTLFTAYGQMVGTPQYMSPEQAEMSGLDVDTRSDIYSLGVLLYELLTGTTPLDHERLRTAAYAEMQRIIREEDPPKPSVRLSSSGDQLTVLAKHRSTNPKGLRQLIRGELDWIVMKALEKNRSRRYETVSAMALDVKNHLSGDPVLANPPNPIYRVRKLLRRHRGKVLTVATLLLCLVGGIIGTSWGLLRAHDSLFNEIAARNRETVARTNAEEASRRAVAARQVAEENLYNADMQRAMTAIREGNPFEAARLLDRHKQSDRDNFDWRLLKHLCQQSHPFATIPLTANPAAGNLSKDETWLGICQTNGVFCLVNLENGQRTEWSLGRPRFWWLTNSFVTFSPDSLHVSYPAGDARSVCVRHLATGKEMVLPGSDGAVVRAQFCPDAKDPLLVTADQIGTVSLWNWATGSVIKREYHGDGVQAIDWASDGRLLVSCGDTEVCVWDADLNKDHSFRPAGLKLPLRINDLRLAPDASVLAIAEGHSVSLWNITSGENIARFDAHEAQVQSVRFASNTTLVSAGRDNVIRIWDLETLREERALRGHSAYVWWLAGPTANGKLVSGGLDRRVMLWKVDAAEKVDSIAFNADQIREIALNPDNSILAAVVHVIPPTRMTSGRSKIVLVSTREFVQKKGMDVDYFVRSASFSAQGVLAVGGSGARSDEKRGSSGWITFWNSLTDDESARHEELPSPVICVRFSPDGRYLAATCIDDCVILDLTTGNRRNLSSEKRAFDGLAWSPDSRLVAAGISWLDYDTPRVIVWDAETGEEVFNSRGPDDHTEGVHCVAFSPDGLLLASGGSDGQIHLHDVPSGELVGVIRAHSGLVWSLTFSRDGRTLISGSGDDTINIWDLEHNELRLSFPAHIDGTKTLALSQDETRLFSGGLWDGTLRVWRAPRSAGQ